jgi:hypothetical protein
VDVISDKLAAHLLVARYGDFELTEAIRPSLDVPVVPRQGFRISRYQDAQGNIQVPALVAAVSRAQLFDLFLALLEPLGEVVDVVLETSHESDGSGHVDLLREHIDLSVLKSHFCDFEELLLNDGCTGVAVLATTGPMEVQFDEHKLLIVYAEDVEPFEAILRQAGLRRNDRLKLITEGEHLHCSEVCHAEIFAQLCYRLGVGEAAERVNW